MIVAVATLAALLGIAIGGGILLTEVVVLIEPNGSTESFVRYILPDQPVWVTIPVALAIGGALAVVSILILRQIRD